MYRETEYSIISNFTSCIYLVLVVIAFTFKATIKVNYLLAELLILLWCEEQNY